MTPTEPRDTHSTADAARRLDALVDRAAHDKAHVVLTREGAPVAAIIPIEALALLDRVAEMVEDEIDRREAERILSDPGSEFVPFEQAMRESAR